MNYKKMIISFGITFYLELVYHLFIFKTFSFKGVLYLILFSLFVSLFIDLFTSVFNKKINKWLFIISLSFCVIIFLSQLINFKFYGNIISVYSMFHGGQVFGWMGAILDVMKENIIACLLLFLPLPLLFIFHRKINSSDCDLTFIKKKAEIFLIIYIVCLGSLNLDKQDLYSAKNLYLYKHVPNSSAQTFGILTTMRIDIERTLSNFEEDSVITTPTLTTIKEEKKKEYNKTNIDFESLINNETNEEIKNIHVYMNSQTPSEKNKYTGMFKGKNLIAITAESFSPIAVNETLTPTLYKLVNTGFNFSNFYTPVYYVSTSDGEYVTLNSLLPKESVWSFYRSSNNLLPYAYGNIFKQMGYTTYAFHDGQYKFYDRNLSHPNMGYTYLACGNGLETKMNCNLWPQSDIEMIDATFDYYGTSEHFATYYMTISGHLQYNFYGNTMDLKNKSYVENLPYSDAIKAYIAGEIELDKALEDLLNKLQTAGKLDDTVIVLSADHYPYGLTTEEMKEIMTINDDKFDIHKNNLIIWNSQMKKEIKIDKYAESLDILPTVLNLFGIDYDSRLLMGSDILSNSDGLVIFNDRSWITAYGKYDAATKVFTPFTSDKLPDNYIENINTIVYNKYVVSKNILDTDYYRYVFKGE